ncbi:M36 family metallopeptidase [Paenibacillus polymyxa]|uniref:M36 family metallopeptidase n=1 Tax=Paenibacillus polymyxa TaxID=1406 RepID=UPI0004DFB064|nr:M36 family metallopeptidase [Paenibacillus polymyxa]
MIQEIDKRNYEIRNEIKESSGSFFTSTEHNLHSASVTNVGVNPTTGTMVVLNFTAPDDDTTLNDKRSFISKAVDYVQKAIEPQGFAPESSALMKTEFVPDPNVIQTSSGAAVVHLQQAYRGIPFYQMSRTVRFSPEGKLEDIVGDNVEMLNEVDTIPQLDVISAMKKANEYINSHLEHDEYDAWGQKMPFVHFNTSNYVPKVIVTFPNVTHNTVLDKGEFSDYIPANLVLFHQNPSTRLAWKFIITINKEIGQYEVVVAADNKQPGEILSCQRLNLHIEAKGNVFRVDGANGREMVPFPLPWSDYPVKPLPQTTPPAPEDWVDGIEAIGNNTEALYCDSSASEVDCIPSGHLKGQKVSGIVTFNPSVETGDEQKILNIFYYCNYMHDFFYLLGFDEKSGNFQRMNITGEGIRGDNVKAHAYSGTVFGTANMGTPVDGISPSMNMGLVESSNRHTAFDADVVFHEFTHGVTTRLVGGPLDTISLRQPQSRGMGEGWSDFFALSVQNYSRDLEKLVTGAWVFNNAAGIRKYKYDDNYPDHFDKIGKERYTVEHAIGEIWCATLMYMNRRFVEQFGKERGYNLVWIILIDALKISRSNPSFLDARDDILQSLKNLKTADKLSEDDYYKGYRCIWQAFSHFGMGPNAASDGPTLRGIVADFTLPSELQ